MKEYDAVPDPWTRLGLSPLENIRIPRGLFRWKVEKKGFATIEDVASGWRSLSFKLEPVEGAPPEMVRVQGSASFKLNMPGFENAGAVPLGDYRIDRYEVTNKEFKKFVDIGGYRKREYWKHRFEKDGRIVPWAEAMREFLDATGRSGPATWEAGDYFGGQGDHPVGGVSWYEAAAYAEFAGKSLPTIYQWNNAAITIQALVSSYILPFSNFSGRGSSRTGSHHGMSRSGTYDMAGNAKEWCWNEADRGKRYHPGRRVGGTGPMPFTKADARSPFQRHASFGFRCVKSIGTNPLPKASLAPVSATGGSRRDARTMTAGPAMRIFAVLPQICTAYDKTDH